MPKTEIPNIGHFAVALDPEGNGFGIFESKGEEEERAPIRSTTTETKVEDSKAISEV